MANKITPATLAAAIEIENGIVLDYANARAAKVADHELRNSLEASFDSLAGLTNSMQQQGRWTAKEVREAGRRLCREHAEIAALVRRMQPPKARRSFDGAIYSDALCLEFSFHPLSMGVEECRKYAALLHTMTASALRCIAARGIQECDPNGTHESAVGAIDVLMQFANQLDAAAEQFAAHGEEGGRDNG